MAEFLLEKKKNLGQFYSENSEKLLKGFTIPRDIPLIEPFCGKGDLIKGLEGEIECFDIDPKLECAVKRDTLRNPPDYNGKFVITNPPYLARNKCKEKDLFDTYKTNDLYKCFVKELIKQNPLGGILILPLNFLTSVRISDANLRRDFFQKFEVKTLNIFDNEKVFDDTGSSVCSFEFSLSNKTNDYTILRTNNSYNLVFSRENNYTIGGELYKLPQCKSIVVKRYIKNCCDLDFKTNLVLKCLDDDEKISLKVVNDEIYEKHRDNTEKSSGRSYASLIIKLGGGGSISKEKQYELAKKFNDFINDYRLKYNSLFLTSYREGNRKRISFGLAFEIINHLLSSTVERLLKNL